MVLSVAFSPDDVRIVSGSRDNEMRVWGAKTGQKAMGPLVGFADWVNSVAFSPGGTRIASGSCDGTTFIWNSENGQPAMRSLQGHSGSVSSITFSPGGALIVSTSHGAPTRVWGATRGELITELTKGGSGAERSSGGMHVPFGLGDATPLWGVTSRNPATTSFGMNLEPEMLLPLILARTCPPSHASCLWGRRRRHQDVGPREPRLRGGATGSCGALWLKLDSYAYRAAWGTSQGWPRKALPRPVARNLDMLLRPGIAILLHESIAASPIIHAKSPICSSSESGGSPISPASSFELLPEDGDGPNHKLPDPGEKPQFRGRRNQAVEHRPLQLAVQQEGIVVVGPPVLPEHEAGDAIDAPEVVPPGLPINPE